MESGSQEPDCRRGEGQGRRTSPPQRSRATDLTPKERRVGAVRLFMDAEASMAMTEDEVEEEYRRRRTPLLQCREEVPRPSSGTHPQDRLLPQSPRRLEDTSGWTCSQPNQAPPMWVEAMAMTG